MIAILDTGVSYTHVELVESVRSEVVNPGPSQQGQLVISPILREDSGWQVLQVGATVTISWVNAPTANVQRVEFYLTPTGTGMTPELLGTDDNPAFTSDGREITPTNNLLPIYTEG